jgi:hypothetical protein
MIGVLPILFGAFFTLATAWSIGTLLLRHLAAALYDSERWLLAFVFGSACLSEIMFALCALRIVYPAVLLIVGLAVIAAAVYSGGLRSSRKAFPPLAPLWKWTFVLLFAAFTGYAFFNALAPEHSADGMAYHLNAARTYQQAHGFPRITTDMYANLSEGVELLYLFAFVFGRHSAATLVHFAFLIALAFLVLCYGRRIGSPAVGVAAAIFTYTCPVILRTATVAYIDVALAAVLFALFYFLQVWHESPTTQLLMPVGILAGFAYAVKYTAFLAVPYALGLVAWKLWRAHKPLLRPLLLVSLCSAAMILPWMLKNWIEVANPVSPFANRIFPNPYIHISLEDFYRNYLATYFIASRWQIPLEVTVKGGQLEGFLGPLFLLTPLALLALRRKEGRQLLLAGIVFVATYFSNIGTRFLIPAVPFVSLALGLTIANFPWLLFALMAVNVVACWPAIYTTYCAPGAWRLEDVPVRAALRLQPENDYLSQDIDYMMAKMIEKAVPPGNRILAQGLGGRAYLPREVIVGYQGAANEVLEDILWVPVIKGNQPVRNMKFDFAPRQIRKLRVVQTSSEPEDQWSVTELRIFDGPRELPRDPIWRLTARPNPWDVQMAFDNSPVTRWRSWQPSRPGMYMEIDLGRMQSVSSVVVESSWDMVNTRILLQGLDTDSKWFIISDHPMSTARAITASLRLAASTELKTRGIGFVFVRPEDTGYADLRDHAAAWGMDLAGEIEGNRLYRIR